MCGGDKKMRFDFECSVFKFELILITYLYYPEQFIFYISIFSYL